jgi:hypothetical protein
MSKFTLASVERRLKRGAYQYPAPEWVARYNSQNRSEPGKFNCAPAADFWFACLQVAARYGIDLKRGNEEDYTALLTHAEEINHLLSFYRGR